MQIAILLLLVAALALLVLGLISTSTPLVVGSVLVSLVAVAAIVRARRQRIEWAAAEAARLARVEADKDETTRALAAAVTSGRAAGTEPADAVPEAPAVEPVSVGAHAAAVEPTAELAGELVEPDAAGTEPPLAEHGEDPVWVIDGRPRYHAWNCPAIHGRTSESVPLAQAVEDGFTPCASCDPDTTLAA